MTIAPRPSATVLVLRDEPLEVLMLRRSSGGSFPGAVVFPGGVVETADGDPAWGDLVSGAAGLSPEQMAVRIAAIRETWEEAGVLLCHPGATPRPGEGMSFIDVVRATGSRLALDELHYFARWVTPVDRARRFDTRFYVTAMPAEQTAVSDGTEMVGLEWVTPQLALRRDRTGEQPLMTPTRLNLERLAESADAASAFAAADARERFVVRPRTARDPDGSDRVVIPARAGYRTEPEG